MKVRTGRFLVFATVVAFSALGFRAWREHKTAVAYRELALIVSSVTNVTVYDVSGFGGDASSNGLSSAVSALFPVEVFSSAAGSAEYRNPLLRIEKGSWLAVLTLRDGTQHRARFSPGGCFFSLVGVPGFYVVPGLSDSQFAKTLEHIFLEQFLPKRNGQKKNTS